MYIKVKDIETVIIDGRDTRLVLKEEDGETITVAEPKRVTNYLLGLLLYEIKILSDNIAERSK